MGKLQIYVLFVHRLQIYVPNIKSMSGLQFYAYNISTISQNLTLGVVYKIYAFHARICKSMFGYCTSMLDAFRNKMRGVGGWARMCPARKGAKRDVGEAQRDSISSVYTI